MDTRNPMYSEVVYLFAENAIPERSHFFTFDQHPSGEKISFKPLSYKMVLSALVYLFDKKYITLTVKDIKKLFIFPGKSLFGVKIKEEDLEITGIEKKLLDNFKTETEISKAVYYLLDEDESSPWGQIVTISKDSLIEKNFLEKETERKNIFSTKKYLFSKRSRDDAYNVYREMEYKMEEFSSNRAFFEIAQKAVKQGIDSRIEQTSSDD